VEETKLAEALPARGRNHLLANLSNADFKLLAPHLIAEDLPLRKQLHRPHTPVNDLYFIDSGLVSIILKVRQRALEVGIIGREGVAGLCAIMQSDRSPNDTVMQIAGQGRRISTNRLRAAMDESATLRRCLLRFAHVFWVQTAHNAFANGQLKVEERLARWLLMAQDRVGGDKLSLTHEFLAVMLCVRRAGVTKSLQALQKKGLITSQRGVLRIVNRDGLVQACQGTYGPPEAEYQRLIP
jgi:CRP-like cAMP-binding protein